MRITQATLQKLVHVYRLIRYVEKYNSKNQRIFDLSTQDIQRLISMKMSSGEETWKGFLDLYLSSGQCPVHSIQFIKDEDEEFVRAHIDGLS
ncbi:hypothetical protein CH375_06565 [Leptospira ellisii]|uniref:Uncharacterized protein n=1 Tax=Leptospira ellisii TaxID=2023197 RepID=A0A2N0B8J8_9LEPT|nr:hypothetical protein CH379_11185 [Leptospira ellisii]PKA05195.1 hypothetical protein CH375_06565 [Leptospira ellisii]